MRTILVALAVAAAVSLGGCGEGGDGADPESQLVERGRVVYQNNCTACHARDPNLDGPVGPSNAGASLELLQAKVLRNEYPPGYTPKRETRAMIALPHLEPELPALAAYLRHVARP